VDECKPLLLGMAAEADDAVVDARSWIIARGGAVNVPSWGKFYLCVLGVYGWEVGSPGVSVHLRGAATLVTLRSCYNPILSHLTNPLLAFTAAAPAWQHSNLIHPSYPVVTPLLLFADPDPEPVADPDPDPDPDPVGDPVGDPACWA